MPGGGPGYRVLPLVEAGAVSSQLAQGQCQPSAVESCAPTKVASSLPPGQFANEASVCPGGPAQCPACGGAQSCSVPERSAPLPFGWQARPAADGQDPSTRRKEVEDGGCLDLSRPIGCPSEGSIMYRHAGDPGVQLWGRHHLCLLLRGTEGTIDQDSVLLMLR